MAEGRMRACMAANTNSFRCRAQVTVLTLVLLLVTVFLIYLQSQNATESTNYGKKNFAVWGDLKSERSVQDKHLLNESFMEMRSFDTVTGWLMESSRGQQRIECPQKAWGVCVRVMVLQCTAEKMEVISQFLPLSAQASVRGLRLSVRAASEDLKKHQNNEDSEHLFGVVAVIKLSDGTTDKFRLNFPVGTHDYLHGESDWVTLGGSTLQSVTVFLACHSYSGTVKFADVRLEPLFGNKVTSDFGHVVTKCADFEFFPKAQKQSVWITEPVIAASSDKLEKSDITVVIQMSMDQLQALELLTKFWTGSLSLAVYVPTKSRTPDTDHEWKRIYLKKRLASLSNHVVDVIAVYGNTADEEYPVNFMKNTAIRQVKTEYMIVLDRNFLPSPNFTQSFHRAVKGLPENEQLSAFVVPAFHYLNQDSIALHVDKEELVNNIFSEEASVAVYQTLDEDDIFFSHLATDYTKWFTARHPYPVTAYTHSYSPYIILRKSEGMPLYDERFSVLGRHRASHTTELTAAGYKLHVIPNIWIMHVPFINMVSDQKIKQDPLVLLESRVQWYEFISDVLRKYKVGICRENS